MSEDVGGHLRMSLTTDDRYVGDAAGQHELLRMSSQEHTIGMRDPGKNSSGALQADQSPLRVLPHCPHSLSTHGIASRARQSRSRGHQRIPRGLAEALQGVFGIGAPDLLDYGVVCRLLELDVACRDRSAGVHDRGAEEAFGVPSVSEHLERD